VEGRGLGWEGAGLTWTNGRVVARSLLAQRPATLGAVGGGHTETSATLPALPTRGRTHTPRRPLLPWSRVDWRRGRGGVKKDRRVGGRKKEEEGGEKGERAITNYHAGCSLCGQTRKGGGAIRGSVRSRRHLSGAVSSQMANRVDEDVPPRAADQFAGRSWWSLLDLSIPNHCGTTNHKKRRRPLKRTPPLSCSACPSSSVWWWGGGGGGSDVISFAFTSGGSECQPGVGYVTRLFFRWPLTDCPPDGSLDPHDKGNIGQSHSRGRGGGEGGWGWGSREKRTKTGSGESIGNN